MCQLEIIEKICTENGTHFFHRSVDVTIATDVDKSIQEVLPSLRFPIRGVVTTAGVSGECNAIDLSPEPFRRMLDVNIIGSFIPAQAAARLMREQGVGGSIVLIASMSGRITNRVSKHLRENFHSSGILTSPSMVLDSSHNSLQHLQGRGPPARTLSSC